MGSSPILCEVMCAAILILETYAFTCKDKRLISFIICSDYIHFSYEAHNNWPFMLGSVHLLVIGLSQSEQYTL